MPTKSGALQRAVQVVYAEARLRRRERRSRRPDRIPRSPAQVTIAWLTDVLCRNAPGAAALPRHVFVKCTSSMAQRLMLGLGGLIGGEPHFYAHVRPLLAQLEIEAPAGYFAAVDARSWRSVVVIEDVEATRGARFWEPTTPLTRAGIEDLLAQVARWHGALWESPRLATWTWLRSPADQARLIAALIGLADRTPVGARRARAVIPPRLQPRQRDLYDGMLRSLTLLGQGPRTYLHGDLHVANTYLTGDGRMGVFDWQVGLQGSWAHDFAYLLTTALAIEDRRAWERELLDLYFERLAAAGGGAPRPMAAWLAYRQATLYPYFAWIYTLGRARLQPRFQPEQTALTLVERIAAAIDDLDSLGAIGL